jgi:hypothetical protein
MQWVKVAYLGVALLVCSASAASAVVIEADDYSNGTILNGYVAAQEGVMLRAEGAGLAFPAVFARSSSVSSTGSMVFGHSSSYNSAWGGSVYEYLRADFAVTASSVSLDFIANDAGDSGAVLEAYDASGALIDSMSSADLKVGDSWNVDEVATLTVSGNIHHIMAKGSLQADWAFDQLNITPLGGATGAVPTPAAATLVLIGLGASGAMRRRLRRNR